MIEWDGFIENLRVFRLLDKSGTPDPLDSTMSIELPEHDCACQVVNVDFITAHLAHEIEDAVRLDASTLGIPFESLSVQVDVASPPATPVADFGMRPWIRYSVMLDSTSDPASIEQLHIMLVAKGVQRLAHEFETPFVGSIVTKRSTEAHER